MKLSTSYIKAPLENLMTGGFVWLVLFFNLMDHFPKFYLLLYKNPFFIHILMYANTGRKEILNNNRSCHELPHQTEISMVWNPSHQHFGNSVQHSKAASSRRAFSFDDLGELLLALNDSYRIPKSVTNNLYSYLQRHFFLATFDC